MQQVQPALSMQLTPSQQALVESPEAQQMVERLVGRFLRRYVDRVKASDLRGAGGEGLARAARRYDPN